GGLTERSGRLEPVRGTGQYHAAGPAEVDLRVVDTRRCLAAIAQGFRGIEHPAPGADHHRVGRPEVLLGAIDDRAHALGDRLVLLMNARDAGVAPRFLVLAIDQVVVLFVLDEPETPEPIRRVTQEPMATGEATGRGSRRRAGLERGRAARRPGS